MKTKTEALKQFLDNQKHKVDLYTPEFEVQVNVIPGPNKIKTDKSFRFADDYHEWAPFRIPNSGSGVDAEPTYRDQFLSWPLEKYVEAIGLTGWNWFQRKSYWVGFDFDSSANHANGLSDSELDSLRLLSKEVPYIELRRSKSGLGYHLYVFFDKPVDTDNHTFHAGLARAILSQLSALLNFDFESKVDTCGGNLWVWHKDTNVAKGGLTVLKAATEKLKNIPSNWKDHVTTNRYAKKAYTDKQELISSTRQAALDAGHRELIAWLVDNDVTSWWDASKNMLVCHTSALKKAHTELGMRGMFETIAEGKDLFDHNCFCFPQSNGSWSVFRYSQGTKEHEYWETTPSNWTTCTLNRIPDFNAACRIAKGTKTKKGEFIFKSRPPVFSTMRLLGVQVKVPEIFEGRNITLSPGKADHEVVISVPYEDGDPAQDDNWYIDGRPKRWESVWNAKVEVKPIKAPDETVRHVGIDGGKTQWFARIQGHWNPRAKDDIKSALKALDYSSQEIEKMLGMAVLDGWEEICLPFQEEYPGNRKWNRDSPQLSAEPKPGKHPHWDKMLSHLGSNLEPHTSDWCRDKGIITGDQYLKLWIASLLRHPFEPLPYLFFYSKEQNTGKSLFHESLKLLFLGGKGYTRAEQSLTNSSGFNGELLGAVLCVVEEVDVNSRYAKDRIKDWVTGRDIYIRPLQTQGFTVRNSTHWAQFSNDASHCPVFPGDTRIVAIQVSPFEGEEIPKAQFISELEKEVPHILYSLLNCIIPASNTRLRIPTLTTGLKSEMEDSNTNLVENFILDSCERRDGWITSLRDFEIEFLKQVPADQAGHWHSDRIKKSIPLGDMPVANVGSVKMIGNLFINDRLSRQHASGRLMKDGRVFSSKV